MSPPQEALPLNHDKDTLHPDWAAMHESILWRLLKQRANKRMRLQIFPTSENPPEYLELDYPNT
jgi:hypothetical protein